MPPQRTPVPEGLKNQLARLFGENSTEAKRSERSDGEWRKTLVKVLHELDRYVAENVDTDPIHRAFLLSGLASSRRALEEDKDFWAGYVEGITRCMLVLLGDYPDHRRRKKGRKAADHYKLNLHRTLTYAQDREQRFRMLWVGEAVQWPGLRKKAWEYAAEFRAQCGYRASKRQFVEWFRKTYPTEYAALF